MPGVPYDWNVVINGSWNTAILTPEGIAKRLFQLPTGTVVEVHVSVDRLAPLKVVHDNIQVVPSNNRLTVASVDTFNRDTLRVSAQIADRAIAGLPETPLSAAGVNLRFKYAAVPDEFVALGECALDDRLSDNGFQTAAKLLRRSLKWGEGYLNVELTENEDSSAWLLLNFHRSSGSVQQLQEWLAKTDEMVAAGTNVVENILQIG